MKYMQNIQFELTDARYTSAQKLRSPQKNQKQNKTNV